MYEQMPVEGMCHEGTPINQSIVATVTLSQVSVLPIANITQLMDEQTGRRRFDKLIRVPELEISTTRYGQTQPRSV